MIYISSEIENNLLEHVSSDDYKTSVAQKVPFVTTPTEPQFASSVDEMKDTSIVYVNTETNTFWRYQEYTGITTERIDIVNDGDNTYHDDARLGSNGTVMEDNAYAGYVTTPLIDLLAYPVPFTLHLDGVPYFPESVETYTRCVTYDINKTKIHSGANVAGNLINILNVTSNNVVVDNENLTAAITFTKTPKTCNDNTDGELQYIRFSAKGKSDDSEIYVTYDYYTSDYRWIDSGIKYAPNVTDEEKQQIADDIISLIDTELLSVVGSGVVV